MAASTCMPSMYGENLKLWRPNFYPLAPEYSPQQSGDDHKVLQHLNTSRPPPPMRRGPLYPVYAELREWKLRRKAGLSSLGETSPMRRPPLALPRVRSPSPSELMISVRKEKKQPSCNFPLLALRLNVPGMTPRPTTRAEMSAMTGRMAAKVEVPTMTPRPGSRAELRRVASSTASKGEERRGGGAAAAGAAAAAAAAVAADMKKSYSSVKEMKDFGGLPSLDMDEEAKGVNRGDCCKSPAMSRRRRRQLVG